MKKKQSKVSKLNLKKFIIAKVNNPQMIIGGNDPIDGDTGDTDTGVDTQKPD